MHRCLAVTVLILQYLCTGTRASSNGSELAPYLLLAFRGRIDAMDMDGNLLNLTITDGYIRIDAIDCNYRTQQVYWITHTGYIKRADINDPQQSVQIIAHDIGARDLAVDWLEDMLYWTNINENKIRRLNLTSTDVLATSPEKIQVEGTSINGSKFRGIVLNPRIRSMYVMDVGVNQLMEIDYTGKWIRNIFTQRSATRPALSFPHDSIIWYEIPSLIGVQGLSQSVRFFHTISSEHVVGIQYYGGKIFWAHRSGEVYCKQWNDTQSPIRELMDYRNDVINDLALMDNPYIAGNYSDYVLPAPPYSSADSKMTVTPATTRHATVTTGRKDGGKTLTSSAAVSEKTTPTRPHTAAPVASNIVPNTANNVGVATRRPQSGPGYETVTTHVIQPTSFSSTPVQKTSKIQTQSSRLFSELPSATASILASISTTTKTPALLTLTSAQSMSGAADSTLLNPSTAATRVPSQLLPSTNSPTTSAGVSKPTSSPIHTTNVSAVHPSRLSSTNALKTSATTSQLTSSPVVASVQSTLVVSASSPTEVPTSSALIATPRKSTSIQPVPVDGGQIAAATPLVESHDGHMTSTATAAATRLVGSHDGHTASASQKTLSRNSDMAGGSLVAVSTTSLRLEIQPSLVVVNNEGSNYKKQTSTQLEAVVITISCLGAAVLIFIGLAILDAIYYFSYERRHGKKATSGILGGVWKIITLPLYCLYCPRYVFRRQRKCRYPYVPRRMDISDVSMHNSDAGHTITTSLSTTNQTSPSTSTNGSGLPLIDHSGSLNPDHSGASTDQPNAEADFTITSSNDGNSDTISGYSTSDAVAASFEMDDVDYQGPPPTAKVKQFELDTKIALGVADYDDDDDEFTKKDLSL